MAGNGEIEVVKFNFLVILRNLKTSKNISLSIIIFKKLIELYRF